MLRLNLLILNGDLPVFPGWGGHEYLHTTHLAQLAHQVGLVSQVHTTEQNKKKQGLVEAGVNLYLWQSPNLIEAPAVGQSVQSSQIRQVGKALYKFVQTWSGRPQDTRVRDFQLRNMSASLLQALNDGIWHAAIVVQSSCAHWLDYLPSFPIKVLVMHDVRARMYERQARTDESLRQRLAYRLEAWLYRRYERHYCQKYDLVVTVSAADEAWVKDHYQPNKVITLPIPVDGNYFAPLPGVTEAEARIVFTGMMNHPPNLDAACFFAQQVFPQVRATIPEAEFWIVGRDPTAEVMALANLPGVVVTGFVPDIRSHIAQAKVVVVPLRFGAGMRQKILEAWAMQKCIVSTRIGAEGLDYQDGVNILIADDAPTLTDRVVQALRDPHLRDQVRMQGRELIIHQHHPDKLAQRYYQAIASVVQEKQQQSSPLKVVIDLRWMRPGVAGGIENLSRSFLAHLQELDRFNQYTLLAPAEAKYDFDLRRNPNFRIAVADGPGHFWRQLGWLGARLLHHRLKVDYWRSQEVESLRRARALDADVALSIPGYIHPDLHPLANVLVVPDIQHEYHPEFFSPQSLKERRRLYTDSIRRADHLCAISEFTRQTVIERLGIPPERVTTTYPAADPLFHPESGLRGHHSPVLEKYGLAAGEYLLFPANTWPHKNHRGAFQALHLLREAYHLEPLLVCTGSSKNAHPDLLAAMQDLGLNGRVRFLGYCPTPDMPALYEGAAALIFPSFFEGFGIPLLEAMWCDCPIVCSNVTSLPELAGDAALLVDPQSPEELAEAVSRVLTDGELRRTLTERGRRQVKQFSWSNFTLQIVRILNQVHEMGYG